MSAQLYNPKANKDVNVDLAQVKTLTEAGWLPVNSEKANSIREEFRQEAIESGEAESEEDEAIAKAAKAKAKIAAAKEAKKNPKTAAGPAKVEDK